MYHPEGRVVRFIFIQAIFIHANLSQVGLCNRPKTDDVSTLKQRQAVVEEFASSFHVVLLFGFVV